MYALNGFRGYVAFFKQYENIFSRLFSYVCKEEGITPQKSVWHCLFFPAFCWMYAKKVTFSPKMVLLILRGKAIKAHIDFFKLFLQRFRALGFEIRH